MGPLTPDIQPPVPGHRRRTLLIALAAVVVVALAAVAAVLVLRPAGSPGQPAATSGDTASVSAAKSFLSRYVDADGRVVRRDQGGDTVSEGQAYGMLAAVVADDHQRFSTIWSWTEQNLHRSDGLISWTWKDGKVQDQNSAADADLDAAWALVLGGKKFHDAGAMRAGGTLAEAILEHETVSTKDGPVLVAGNWAQSQPYAVNPSYFSPVAYAALGQATGDPKWGQVANTSRTIVADLVKDSHLPPDWASVSADGVVNPASSPSGQSPRFSEDAQRVPVWYASSCTQADRQVAASMQPLLAGRPEDQQRAVYDLAGSPQVGYDVPLGQVAASAAAGAAGDHAQAADELADAKSLADQQHTYYGSAWLALGRTLLTTDLLGSCPTQGE